MSGFNGDTKIIYSKVNQQTFMKSILFKDAFDLLAREENIEIFTHNPYNLKRDWKVTEFECSVSKEWVEFVIEDFCNRAAWTKFKVTSDHLLPVLRDNILSDLLIQDVKPGDKLLFDVSLYTMCEIDCSDILHLTINDVIYSNNEEKSYTAKVVDEESPYFVLANGLIVYK